MTEQTFRYDLLTIIVLFLILSTVFIVYFPLLAAITLGLTLAIVLQPLNQKFCERFSPARSAALTTVLAVMVIGLTLVLVVNLLLKGGGQILAMMQIINDWLMSLAPHNLISGKQLADTLDSIKTRIHDECSWNAEPGSWNPVWGFHHGSVSVFVPPQRTGHIPPDN